MGRFYRYFFNGLIFVVPLSLTVYIFYLIFTKIDKLLGLPIPGIGFLVTIILITFIGFLASNYITNKFLNVIDKVFKKMPITRLLYTSIKDILVAFLGEKKSFERPVFVSLSSESNVKVIGFVTKESLSSLGMDDDAAVYLPQSYNFAGNLIIVPKSQLTPINASSSEVMAFIVSGGVIDIYHNQK